MILYYIFVSTVNINQSMLQFSSSLFMINGMMLTITKQCQPWAAVISTSMASSNECCMPFLTF